MGNQHINKLLKATDVRKTLERIFYLNSTIGYLKQYLFTLLSFMEEDQLSNQLLLDVFHNQNSSEECSLLGGLSVFEMCYHEYDKFSTRKAKMFRYDRAVVMKAWEALQDLELITPLDRGTKVQKEYKLHQLQIPIDMIMTVVESGLPLSVKEWA